MTLKAISSRDNPTYRHLLALAQQRKARASLSQTLLDGEHLVESALSAGCMPMMLVFSESAPDSLRNVWLQRLPNTPAFQLSASLFKALSPVDHPSGLMAVVPVPEPDAEAQAFSARAHNGCIMLLDRIQDPGNLGALMRVAAATDCAHVFLSAGCTEAWSPKALRGGQGAQFGLSVHENCDLVALAKNHAGPVYAGLLGAKQSLFNLNLSGPVGFAFGNEGAGLSDALRAVCAPFVIPMSGGVESLNVATAAAVCLFERVRQRQLQQERISG
jgi:TrmH family RNA methyltransferase